MACFMIAGKSSCPNRAHAQLVAEYLNKHLPYFRYRTISKPEGDWQLWLETKNDENRWHHTESPIIWKEITVMGGKPYLIGGLSEFWEYCYDYYGIQSKMNKSELLKLVEDAEAMNSRKRDLITTISVFGAHNKTTDFLLLEIQENYQVRDNEVLQIRLYDENFEDADQNALLLDMVDHIKTILPINPKSLTIVCSLIEAIENCDILLIIKDYSRQSSMEDLDDWLWRCQSDMLLIASEINMHAKRTLKVIFCHTGPVCFNASVLIENCTMIRLANVVCVTANEGLGYLEEVSQMMEIPVKELNCPPVWGFSGIRSYVDIGSVFVLGKIFRPFSRALKVKEGTTLPKGRIKKEMRVLSHLKTDEALQQKMAERKKRERVLMRRTPVLTQIRAFGSLIKLWFSDEPKDNIISLGVISNGSFGFPSGVVFSQAVILNEKNIWEPFSNFPISKTTQGEIDNTLKGLKDILERYRLGAALE